VHLRYPPQALKKKAERLTLTRHGSVSSRTMFCYMRALLPSTTVDYANEEARDASTGVVSRLDKIPRVISLV
jgi:hypothetical protein